MNRMNESKVNMSISSTVYTRTQIVFLSALLDLLLRFFDKPLCISRSAARPSVGGSDAANDHACVAPEELLLLIVICLAGWLDEGRLCIFGDLL